MFTRLMTVSSVIGLLTLSNFTLAENQGRSCGTPTPTATQLAKSSKLAAANVLPFPQTGIVIPIAFHVIQTEAGLGNVSDADIQKQIDVLNKAYTGTGFKFSLSSTDHTINDAWFSDCANSTTAALAASQLAIDPAHVYNVYTCQPFDLLGYSQFPQTFPESSIYHGTVLDYSSLPNGSAVKYNLGATLVHETGHYLGLYHTFEGGCLSKDKVKDVASERSPSYACNLARDTCQGQIGRDPVTNFMDYSYDSCMTEFSLGQIILMQQSVAAWRPSLLLTTH